MRLPYLLALCLLSPLDISAEERLPSTLSIADFSSGRLDGWKPESFSDTTHYDFVRLGGEIALKAVSDSSASGLYKEIQVDLEEYPYLNWRWRVDKPLNNINETLRSGDDFSARVYVVVSGGWFFWRTKAMAFVWSSRHEKGAQWPNAYAPDNAQMVSVRSAADSTGVWYAEKQNMLKVITEWLGENETVIDAVAIMTDTDDSGSSAVAYYGDIYFSRE